MRLQEKEERLLISTGIVAVCGGALALFLVSVGPLLFSSGMEKWRAEHGGWTAFLYRPWLPTTLSCGVLIIGLAGRLIYGIGQTASITKECRWLRLGLRGEQAVAEKLSELAPDGYRSFHDFPAGKDWNIDHVVVGPGGVFAIETKTRSKRKAPPGKKDQEVLYDGKVLEFPWFSNGKAVTQAEASARWLATYLRKATGIESVWVTGLLLIPGWYVSCTTNPQEHAIRAMPETALPKHLRGLPRVLSDQQIQQIAFQVEQKCRDVEF
jgi:hypothetical protein